MALTAVALVGPLQGTARGQTTLWEATLTPQTGTSNIDLGFFTGVQGSLSDESFVHSGTTFHIDTFGIKAGTGGCSGHAGTSLIIESYSGKGWQNAESSWALRIGSKSFGFNNAKITDTDVQWCNHSASDVGLTAGTATTVKIVKYFAPARIGNLKATAGYSSVALSWTTPGSGGRDISKHQYCAETSATATCGDDDWTDIPDSGKGKANAAGYTITSGLTDGTAYYFRVRAVNSVGEGADSNQASATPLARQVPSTITDLKMIAGDGLAKLRWSAADPRGGTIERYQYCQKTTSTACGSGDWTDIPNSAPGEVNDKGFNVPNLINGATYYFKVRAESDLGFAAASNEVSGIPGGRPSAPSQLKAQAGTTAVQLNWRVESDGGSPLTKHQVCVKTDTSTCGSFDWTDIPNSGKDEANEAAYLVEQLQNNREYRFRIRAVNVNGESPESNEAKATPSVPPWRLNLVSQGIRRGGKPVDVHLRLLRDPFDSDQTIELRWGGAELTGDVRGGDMVLKAGELSAHTKITAPKSGGTEHYDVPDRRPFTAHHGGRVIGELDLAVHDSRDTPKPSASLRLDTPSTIREGEDIELVVELAPIGLGRSVEIEIHVGPDTGFLREGGNRTITFEPGQRSDIVRYETVDDEEDDSEYPLTFVLYQPPRDHERDSYGLNPDRQAVEVLVLDGDGEDELDILNEEAHEGDGAIEFAVFLQGRATQRLSVDYATEDITARAGQDYVARSGTLTWNEGDARTKKVRIELIDDSVEDDGETFRLKLSNPQPAGEVSLRDDEAIGTIRNSESEAEPDPLTASFSGVPSSHDGENSSFSFTLDFSVEPQVSYRTLENTAFDVDNGEVVSASRKTSGSNLSWRIVVEPDGDDAVTVTLPETSDCSHDAGGVCTEDGTKLSNRTTATIAGPTTEVVAPVVPSIGVGDAAAEEGDGVGFTVSLSESTTVDVTVDYEAQSGSASRGSDFEATSGTLTFGAGRTSKTVTVRTTEDSSDEDDETFTLQLSNPGNATLGDASATGTIEDDDEPPLTASFSNVPDEHDGTEFVFHLDFSDNPELSYQTLKNGALEIRNGTVRRAQRRTSGSNQAWKITIEPDGLDDVSIELPKSNGCSAPNICTGDGRQLSNASSASVAGPVGVSVADARVQEDAGAELAFVVTLSRAAAGAVSVDYATSDGSAQAGVDYTAASGTLTLSAGQTSKTIAVAVLDDDHDEGSETLTLSLSNAAGGVLTDGDATGTIENRDPLPRALLARFGRTAAVHVVEHVEERLQAPRAPGFDGRFAGQNVRRGGERDMALGFLSRLGGIAGPGGGSYGGGIGHGLPGAQPGTGGASALGARNVEGIATPIGAGGGFSAVASGGLGRPGGMPGAGPQHGGGLMALGLGDDLLTSSGFRLNRESHGGVLSFWSRGARSYFSGREGTLGLSGDVRTTMVGADYARGPVVAGLSLSHSRGLGEYAGVSSGQVLSSVTGLYPWLGYKATERVTVWGVAGYGAGGLLLTPAAGAALGSPLSMAMAAGGTRGELVAGGGRAFELAFKADALWVGTSIDGADGPAGRLQATDAAVTRLRTGLEASRRYALGGRLSLQPLVEVGLRHDGGDAETGAGVDVGTAIVMADAVSGLSLDLRVRTLVLHQAEGFSERGFALSFTYNPSPATPLGLTASVTPSWGGEASGGAAALWGRETMASMGDGGFGGGSRLDGQVGYGLPLGRRLVGTPRIGFSSSEHGRDYRAGYALRPLEAGAVRMELGVDAQVRESPLLGGIDKGVLAGGAIGW